MKIISWNMAHKHESWRQLLDLDIDLALLQEAGKPISALSYHGRESWLEVYNLLF